MGDKSDNTTSNPSAATKDRNPAALAEEKSFESPQHEEILQNVLLCLDNIPLEFDFKGLDVLEDEKATPAKIEALKEKLGAMVSTRLFSIANSIYFGKLRSGNIL